MKSKDLKYGGALYNGINVPKTVKPSLIISAFENPIDENKVEEYTNIMRNEMLSHSFPAITGFPTVIDDSDVGNYFMSGEEITEEHIGKQVWKVWDGHHRVISAIAANLPYIEVELEYAAITDKDEYLKDGGHLKNENDIEGQLILNPKAKEVVVINNASDVDKIKFDVGGEFNPKSSYQKFLDELIKKTTLNENQLEVIKSKEFKSWFGDWENDPANASKVVDEKGMPLMVYRGGAESEDYHGHEFKLGLNLLNKPYPNLFGHFFTTNYNVADRYFGGGFNKNAHLYRVFLNIKNVLDVRELGDKSSGQKLIDVLTKKRVSFLNHENLKNEIINYEAKDGYRYDTWDYWDIFPKLREVFIESGFDGVVFKDNSTEAFGDLASDTFVVFESNQIKLADNKTFDGSNSDIRFDDGGSVLLAPNGKKSNLNESQYKLVRTPEFKAWFGDWENDPENASKVVDSNGEPLVVYHGFLSYSKKDWFYEFKSLPAFFSTRRAFAEQYAETKSMDAGLDKDANSYECFLNIKKLFDPKDKSVIDLANQELPEKIKVSHGTMWFLDANIDKEDVVEQMSGTVTIYPDHMTEDILKANVGDIIKEKVAMSQYEERILLYKDEDWGYTTDLGYFNKKMEKEVAEYVNEGSSSVHFDRKQITYKGQRFYPYVVDKETYNYKLNEEPIAVEFRNDVEKYKKYFIENINTLPRDDDKRDYFSIKLKDFDKYGYTSTISVKKRNLKSYKTKAKDNWTMFENDTVQKFLTENSFGGWISFEKGDKTYAVYEAQNIKLADGTNTTFDMNNKDIRYTDGGGIGESPLPIGTIIYKSQRGGYGRGTDSYYEIIDFLGLVDWTVGKTNDVVNKIKLAKYVVYPLKSNLKEVKGNREEIAFPVDLKDKISNRISYGISHQKPTGKLISQSQIDTESRRSSTESKVEWQGVKPAYLMTKDEYNKEVTPKFREFNRFIGKNELVFSKPDYQGINYTDWETFKKSFVPKYKYDTVESSFKSSRSYKNREAEIEQASPELVKKLNDYLIFLSPIFGEENMSKVQSDESGSNKRAIRRAIDDGTYEKLLREGKINFTLLKNVFDSVSITIPSKLEKIEKEVVELGLTADVKQDYEKKEKEFIIHVKQKFKEDLEHYYESYVRTYQDTFSRLDKFYKKNKNKSFKSFEEYNYDYIISNGKTLNPIYNKGNKIKEGEEKVITGYKRDYDFEKLDKFGKKIYDQDYFKNNKSIKLVDDWKSVLDKAARDYANSLFDEFAKMILGATSSINILAKTPPLVKYGYIEGHGDKGFNVWIDLEYPNGFVLSIETTVIYAGGYNIQVLHTRGLFKFQNKGKYIDSDDVLEQYKKYNFKTDKVKQVYYAKGVEEDDGEIIAEIERKRSKSFLRRQNLAGEDKFIGFGDFNVEGRERYEEEDYDEQDENGSDEKSSQITETEDMIELLKNTLAENPNDTETKDMLELLEITLVDLKAKKFNGGGEIKKEGFEIIPNEQTPNVPKMNDAKSFIKNNSDLLNKFLEFAKTQTTATGLAANQTSIDGKRFMQRVIAINKGFGHWELAINPIITEYIGDKETKHEGCLTWKGKDTIVERSPKVNVSYYTIDGKKVTDEVYSGFDAQVWQHETDHLNGVKQDVQDFFAEGGVMNPYAVCTVSVGSKIGTQERSKWTPAQMNKFERCVLKVKDKMGLGGGVKTLLYQDENHGAIIYDDGFYKISVNDINDAKYFQLYDDTWKRIGVLETRVKYLDDYHGYSGKFLAVHAIYIDKPHQDKGFGLKMYKLLQTYSADDVIGFLSYLPDRANKKVIPKIYSHFNNVIVEDYHIVTFQDGGIVKQIVYISITDSDGSKVGVYKFDVNSEIDAMLLEKLAKSAIDLDMKINNIDKKEYEEYSYFDEISINEIKDLLKSNDADESSEDHKKGGAITKSGAKIIFNANRIPNKDVYEFALNVKTKYPKVWDLGGNIFGNQAFKNLGKVIKRGYWMEYEKPMYIKWQSFMARHKQDFRIEGVIANLKWLSTVDEGWVYMKKLINDEIKKRYTNGA